LSSSGAYQIEPGERFLGPAMWDRYNEALAASEALKSTDYWRIWGLYSWMHGFEAGTKGRAQAGAPLPPKWLEHATHYCEEAIALAEVLGLPADVAADARARSIQQIPSATDT
jgi:hypothetical protein